MSNESPYLVALKERVDGNVASNVTPLLDKSKMTAEFSPLSGSEPTYDPGRWNNNERIKYNHNCYSYVLNKIVSSRKGKPQPGYYSGYPILAEKDYKCQEFYRRLKRDVPSLYKIDFDTPCRRGFHKGFIAIDPKTSDQDYHFYRQDSNGYWSHKPGRNDAVDVDADGAKIKNPFLANRKYKYFDYSEPCFFFCVNTGLAGTRAGGGAGL